MLYNNTLLNFGSNESRTLNKEFNNLITKILKAMTDEELLRVYTYDVILNEWLEEEKISYIDEFKYRVTDGEDMNEVFLDIIESDSMASFICINQKEILKDYITEDKFKNFYE